MPDKRASVAAVSLSVLLIGGGLRAGTVSDTAAPTVGESGQALEIAPEVIAAGDEQLVRVQDISPSGGGAAADASDELDAEVGDDDGSAVLNAASFSRRPYVAIGAGISRLEPRSPSAALTVSENMSSGFEVGVGYDFTRWLSGEFYAADIGAAEIDFIGTDVGDIGYQVYGATAVFYLFNSRDGFVPGTSSRSGAHRREGLSFYTRFGIGGLSNDSDRVSYRQDHAAHAVYGAGLEYGFQNGFAARAELQAFDTDARYAGLSVLKRFGRVVEAAPLAAVPAAVAVAAALPAPEATPEVADALDAFDMPIVHFAFDRSDLSTDALASLDSFVQAMQGDQRLIAIEGHTDWIGPERYNEGLSDRRADAVRDYLISQGLEATQLTARGFGESRPVTRNTTEEGRALNRRAEIIPQ